MNDHATPSRKNLLIAAVVLIAVWGIAGTMGAGDTPYSGFFTDGNNTVIQVQEGSPAEMAGLQTGDVLTSIGGIAVADSRAATERGRAAVGETRTFVVDRNGQSASVDVTYAAVPRTQSLMGHLGSLIGVAFLLSGLLAYLKRPNATTHSLAWFTTCFGLTFVAAPYFSSALIRTVAGAVTLAIVVTGFALLLDFLMQAGSDEAYQDKKTTPNWVYAPALAVAALLVGVTILQPAATSGLNVAMRSVIGLFVVGYLGGALVQVVRNYTGADADRRESRQLGLMMGGAVVGLGPATLASLVTLASPSTVIPTSQYWFMALAAIPLTFAAAAIHGSENTLATEAKPARAAAAPAPSAAPPEAPAPPPPAAEPLKTRSVGGTDGVVGEDTDASGGPPETTD